MERLFFYVAYKLGRDGREKVKVKDVLLTMDIDLCLKYGICYFYSREEELRKVLELQQSGLIRLECPEVEINDLKAFLECNVEITDRGRSEFQKIEEFYRGTLIEDVLRRKVGEKRDKEQSRS